MKHIFYILSIVIATGCSSDKFEQAEAESFVSLFLADQPVINIIDSEGSKTAKYVQVEKFGDLYLYEASDMKTIRCEIQILEEFKPANQNIMYMKYKGSFTYSLEFTFRSADDDIELTKIESPNVRKISSALWFDKVLNAPPLYVN